MNEDYFIAKYEAIPEDKIIAGKWIDGKGGCCGMGHCGRFGPYQSTPESLALAAILPNWQGINDGFSLVYKQETPKQRLLAALRDAKKYRIANELIESALLTNKKYNYDFTKMD